MRRLIFRQRMPGWARRMPGPSRANGIPDPRKIGFRRRPRRANFAGRAPDEGKRGSAMSWIWGLDAMRGAWMAVGQDTPSADLIWRRVASLAELLAGPARPALVTIDVPIGLPEEGARECDVEARRLLGPRRHSVFPAPIRAMLSAATQGDASAIRARIEGKRVSSQTWSIMSRIGEVDALLRHDATLQPVVHEVHAELCFLHMNGGEPLPHTKQSTEGLQERVALLERHFGDAVGRAIADVRRLRAARHDVLDAFAALWTARRLQDGIAVRIPADPPVDACGLRMAITA
jgi:predicted RNase H-like nuclease